LQNMASNRYDSDPAEEAYGLWPALTRGGVFPLMLVGIVLIFAGLFLVAQSMTGELLPHDVRNLGMNAAQLRVFNAGTIVGFIFHDRVSFGGSIISVGLLYAWLAYYPLRRREAWAWWLFLLSGIYGFGSFLTYLGTTYLDTWHAVGTLLLLPIYIVGLVAGGRAVKMEGILCLLRRRTTFNFKSAAHVGNCLLLFIAGGLVLGGCVIMGVGMTSVFVPQDLEYMHISVCGLDKINARLVPILAHDRASFGGGLATTGIMFFFSIYCSKPSRALWEILALSITNGFVSAIAVHHMVGYTIFSHLLPAYVGLGVFLIGMVLTYRQMHVVAEAVGDLGE
jgi:hypothetical protein